MSISMWFIRAIFLVAGGAAGYKVADCQLAASADRGWAPFYGIIIGVIVSLIVITIEEVFTRRPLSSLSAIVLGLMVGFVVAFILHKAVSLALGPDAYKLLFGEVEGTALAELKRLQFDNLLQFLLTCLFCYLAIATIYRTKDDFNFVIPYVEFKREQKGARPIILDTSAIIDGRVVDICGTKVLDGTIVIPRFVLEELHKIADASERLKRSKGRRGLDVLRNLQENKDVIVKVHETHLEGQPKVDDAIVALANTIGARVITCDFNLSKVAELQDVDVININDLANALKPAALPGEDMKVEILREGEQPGQGVGYLPDGTMVVVEQGKSKIGQEVIIVVTSAPQTSAGRMIFGRLKA